MTEPMRRGVRDQIAIQFLEAEVESGFALVDEARGHRYSQQPTFRSRALTEASAIVADIETRLNRLVASESIPFLPLVAELRHEIAALEQERD